ncbi:MAG: HEPN domain-containing protein, partial [Verrucomicrobiota bacterium]
KLCDDPEIWPNISGFHVQETVEKSIKALLIHAGERFPFTHDLDELFDLYTGSNRSIPFDRGQIDQLTPYATHRRYPGYLHQPGVKEQQRLLALAEDIFAWAQSIIGQPN